MKIKRYILFILILLSFSAVYSQKNITRAGKYYLVPVKVIGGDTLPYIELPEVVIFPELVFKNKRQRRKYRKLVRDLKKVYPYAKLASIELKKINAHLATLKTEREQQLYINKQDKRLKEEFKDELMSLTINQGKLLIKLIDRETGYTSYHLIKELKGSFTAFIWQSVARLFGTNLKAEYDPDKEDKLIERIIILIEHGQL